MNADTKKRLDAWRAATGGLTHPIVDLLAGYADGSKTWEDVTGTVSGFQWATATPAHANWHDAEDDYPQPRTKQELTWGAQLGLIDDDQYEELLGLTNDDAVAT